MKPLKKKRLNPLNKLVNQELRKGQLDLQFSNI